MTDWNVWEHNGVRTRAEIKGFYGPKALYVSKAFERISHKLAYGYATAGQSSVYYLALRGIPPLIGVPPVEGMVVLVERDSRELRTKFLHESVLPWYFDAPKELLDMLTPTTDSSSDQWRTKCYQRLLNLALYKAERERALQ